MAIDWKMSSFTVSKQLLNKGVYNKYAGEGGGPRIFQIFKKQYYNPGYPKEVNAFNNIHATLFTGKLQEVFALI